MFEARATVRNRPGIHARPAAELVQCASRFDSEIFIEANGLTIHAKSIMGVMMLAAVTGTPLRVRAVGEDEREAVEAIVALIHAGFGEEITDVPDQP